MADIMVKAPMIFNDFLHHTGLIDEVYQAMSNPDLAVIVIKMLDVLNLTDSLPTVLNEGKSESKSTEYRNEGNRSYARSKFQSALICYNKALLYAPKDSRALKLAYSNRSALLHKVQAYSACLNDIYTCFSLGCPLDIIVKLRLREEDANSKVRAEKLSESTSETLFCREYFAVNEQRNPQIPCASMAVGVIIENDVPKIVAATDIKVGAVIALEKAFVSMNDPSIANFACYYCHRIHLNLQPCEGCCNVLFCGETCREKCMKESHAVECQIIGMINKMSPWVRMSLLAVLKMKQMCASWSELIEASHNMGSSRMKTSSINEIYDSKNKFSLLSIKDERHFLHGPLYNTSITCAYILYYLENVAGFFPESPEERNEARRAVGRLLLFLSLYTTLSLVVPSTTVKVKEKTEFYDMPNFKWFSFIGKLKNTCEANTLLVGLHKYAALVAQQPIKRGTEISVSLVAQWLDCTGKKSMALRTMFTLCEQICNCSLCKGDRLNITSVGELTDIQKKNFHKLNISELYKRFNIITVPEIYTKVCKTLAVLSNVPFSDEYRQVYKFFLKCLLLIQNNRTRNYILDYE